MKTQKLLVIVAIVCLCVGASGAAMALDDCSEGLITGEVEGDIIIDGQSCTINDAVVTGNIEVIGSEDITIVGSEVSGRILVEKSRFATLVANRVRNIVIRNNELASVVANAARRTVRVNRNVLAFVKQNGVLVAIKHPAGLIPQYLPRRRKPPLIHATSSFVLTEKYNGRATGPLASHFPKPFPTAISKPSQRKPLKFGGKSTFDF